MDDRLRNKILDSVKMPRLRIERALIVTDVYKETEGEPMIIRRAKVLHELANQMPIVILDWQLVVGSFSSEPFAVSPHPESCWQAILTGLDEFATRKGEKYRVTEEDKKSLRETLPWWQGRSLQDVILNILPTEVKAAYEAGLLDTGYFTQGCGNFSADYNKVLSKGFAGIGKEVEEKIARLDLTRPEEIEKMLFYRAALICGDALVDYARRHAELAGKMAASEKKEDRRNELLQIARNCERVPAQPAGNFFEALQAFWFTHLFLHHEAAGGAGIVAGRLDQILEPLAKGTDRGEKKRWLSNLWINYNQIMYFLPGRTAYIWSGHPVSEQPTIGGVNDQNGDASNDLTELMLEVEKEIRLPQPDIAVMYHPKINRKVLQQSCETLPLSMKPKFFNYDLCLKQALERGMDRKDLADLVAIGCVAMGPQGKVWGSNGFSFFNLAKVLELTLYNGIDPMTGARLGPETGDPLQMGHFDSFREAYRRQLEHAIRLCVTMIHVIEQVHRELNPQPLASMLIDDCIDRGLTVWQGGARYNIPGVEAVGLANVADSLAVLKKFVFEEKKIKMEDLLVVIGSDFAGPQELLREQWIHEVPKYGNDEDSVDTLAAWVAEAFCGELRKYRGRRGPFCPSLAFVSAHVGLGGFVGALPDGRKAKRPLADGMSPSQGVCFCGPTAVMKSVTKVDHAKASNGTILNMKFNAGTLTHPEKREKFVSLLETYMDLGGYHVQFNIIDTAKLRDAQLHPENYPELLVRVAAYVAQFRQLPKELQDDIIARSEFE